MVVMNLSNTKSTSWRFISIAVALTLLSIHPSAAQVPQLINYQGRVVVGSTNFNGSGQFKFALVDTTGATTYWSNDGTSSAGSAPTSAVTLPVTQGLYSVALGDGSLANMKAIPASVFNNTDVRLRIWFNDGTHGFQQLTPDQRIAAVGYAMMAANVPNGAITSAQIANGAVGLAQIAPNLLANGSLSFAPLAGITGAGTGVLGAAANAVNTPNGLATLDANGLLNPNTSPGLGLRVGNSSPLNIVCVGDSITAGTGASVQPPMTPAVPLGLTNLKQADSTYWVASLRQMGFCQNGKTVWNLGQGSQKIAQAWEQYTNSPGVTVTATLTNGSTSGKITSTGGNGFVRSGAVVTSTIPGIPANSTGSLSTVATACSVTDLGNGTTTITVTGPTAGLVNGMFVISSTNNLSGGNGSIGIPADTTITISGNTITTSAPISVYQSLTQPNQTVSETLYFVSPTITLSSAFTGTTGSLPVTFGGTLVTSIGTFTAGSTSVTGVSTTGSAAGLISYMGIGSMATAPGSTFTISGSTLTLSQSATASGTFTFYASTPTYNTFGPTMTYDEQTNTTPHLLSPAVTGVPGVFLNFYGVNDAGTGTDLSSYETTYLALNALARADGYTVIDMTQVPLTSTAFYGYASGTGLQDSMTTWTRAQSYPTVANGWDYLIDVAAAFPQGHPATDNYHYRDGIHPNDLGHQLIAGLVNDRLFTDIAPSTSQLAYPFTNGGINENWLPSTAVLTDKSNVFGAQGAAVTQTITGQMTIISNYQDPSSGLGLYGYSNDGQTLDFGTQDPVTNALTNAFQLAYNPNVQTLTLGSTDGACQLVLNSSTNSLTLWGSSVADANGNFPGLTVLSHNGSYNPIFTLSRNNGETSETFQLDGVSFGIADNTCGTWLKLTEATGAVAFTSDVTATNGNIIVGAAGKTLSIKGGSNAASGTVTLSSGTATITSSAITANSVLFFSRVTANGIPGPSQPVATVSAGSATVTGAVTDNSTYNWGMILINQ